MTTDAVTTEAVVEKRKIDIPRVLSVKELADLMAVSPVEVIKELMKNGVMAAINQVIDFDTAAIVASDMGFEAIEAHQQEQAEVIVERSTAPPNHSVPGGPLAMICGGTGFIFVRPSLSMCHGGAQPRHWHWHLVRLFFHFFFNLAR